MSDSAPVIRVGLLGGLGNQLFQASTGLALARRLGARLEFDISRYREGTARRYELGPFTHGATPIRANPSALGKLLSKAGKKLMPGRFQRPAGWRGAIFRERGFAYDSAIETIAGSCFLSGYFQSEKYFRPFAPDIRAAFDLEKAATPRALDFRRSMPAGSLAVHVRIGDYASQAFAKVHAVLTPDYYRAAVEALCTREKIARIYLFTDTPEIAPALVPPGSAFELVTGFGAHDDMYLMSRARHHVIANSTFSWWGAWLCPEAGGTTIAPAQWFTPEEMRRTDTRDLYPEGWVKL